MRYSMDTGKGNGGMDKNGGWWWGKTVDVNINN